MTASDKFGNFGAISIWWWGRQDSNLRSHEAADLQSAPFATRDTPPFRHHRRAATVRAVLRMAMRLKGLPDQRAPGRARLWAKVGMEVNRV